MKRLRIILLFLILSKSIFASRDRYDYVVLNGYQWLTYDDMYRQYPNRNAICTKIYDEVERADMKIHPENYVSNIREELTYHSTWMIKENKVYLTKIKSVSSNADLGKIFGDKVADGNIFADWLTDTIILSSGEVLAEGAKSIHDTEIELKIKNGYLIDSTRYKNYVAKISKFQVDNSFIYKRIDWAKLPNIGSKSIQAYIGIKPNKDGCFESFTEDSFVFINSTIVKDTNNVYLKEAFRVARLIPEWTVLYRKNKIVAQPLMIYFDNKLKRKYNR